MRVIGGSWRGRRLEAPEGRTVRPTSDRAREAIFNILAHGAHTGGEGSPIPDARVLDAFAGSGALGIEALSRGAAQATFLDSDAAAVRAIQRNLDGAKGARRRRPYAGPTASPRRARRRPATSSSSTRPTARASPPRRWPRSPPRAGSPTARSASSSSSMTRRWRCRTGSRS